MPVKVDQFREVVRDLQRLGVDVEDLKDVMAAIAREGAEEAARRAPHKTGALANTIRGNRAKGKAVITAGRGRVKYAGAINYGWPRRNIRARKFLQEADEAMETRAPELFEEGIAELIERLGLG
jgi:hypothetical protein